MSVKFDDVFDLSGIQQLDQLIQKMEAVKSNVDNLNKSISKLDLTKKEDQKTTVESAKSIEVERAKYDQLKNQLEETHKKLDKLTKEKIQAFKVSKDINNVNTKAIKLEAKLGKTVGKSAVEQAELKLQIQQNTKKTKELARENLGLVDTYEKEGKRLVKLRREFKNVALEQGSGSKAAKKLKKQVTQLDQKLKKVDGSAGQFGRTVGNYPTAFKGAASAAKTMIGSFIGITAIVAIFRNIGKSIVDFQQKSANLAAVIGKTRSEISALTKDARRLGSTTAFTSSEVLELQTAFAKLGFSEREILNLSEATLDLAAATGTDLSTAAEVAGATVRGFGLESSETQRVVDVMAKSFSSSALDMSKFSTAMSTVAPVAKSAGVSLERTTSLLGLLVDRGLDASTAGTSLRNVFLTLSQKGLTFEQAMSKINNAADKNAVALDLFGKRGATTATILAETGVQASELEEKLNNAGGAAKKMADEQLDTLSGSATKLSSAWDGFILSLEDGDGVIATTARAVLDFTTNVIGGLRNLQSILDEMRGKEDIRVQTEDINEFKAFTKAMENRGFAFDNLKNASEAFLEVDKRRLKELKSLGKEEQEQEKEQIKILEQRIKNIQGFVLENEKAALRKIELNRKETEDKKENVKKQVKAELELTNAVKKELTERTFKTDEENNKIKESFQSVIESFLEESEIMKEQLLRNFQIRQEQLQNVLNTAQLTSNFFNALTQNAQQKDEERLIKLEEMRERELSLVKNNEQAKLAINKKFDREKEAIERKQAQRQRKLALIQKALDIARIIIDTQRAAAAALLPPPFGAGPIFGAALIPAIIARGALAAATVIAQPIPQFWRGTENAPGGLAWVGEKGNEIVENKGQRYLTPPSATLVDLPKGAKVMDAIQTDQILRNATTPIPLMTEHSNVMTLDDSKILRLESAIQSLPIQQWNIKNGELKRSIKKGNNTYWGNVNRL